MGLADEKYMLLTTFRKSGAPVATPVWLADLGSDEVGFWTSSASGKIKRLRHTQRVTVQLCNMKGDPAPGSQPIETTARIVTGDELREVRERIVARYGFQTKLSRAGLLILSVLRRNPMPYADVGVAVLVPEILR